MNPSIHDTPEHELLREQIARFLAREVEPYAEAWERLGMVPREVLRQGRVLVRFMAWNQEGQEGGGLAGLQPLAPGAAPQALGMLR